MSGLPPTAAELRLSQEFSDVSISISGSTFGCVSSAKSVYSHISKGINIEGVVMNAHHLSFELLCHMYDHPNQESLNSLQVLRTTKRPSSPDVRRSRKPVLEIYMGPVPVSIRRDLLISGTSSHFPCNRQTVNAGTTVGTGH